MFRRALNVRRWGGRAGRVYYSCNPNKSSLHLLPFQYSARTWAGPRAPNLRSFCANLAPLPPFYQQGGQGGGTVTVKLMLFSMQRNDPSRVSCIQYPAHGHDARRSPAGDGQIRHRWRGRFLDFARRDRGQQVPLHSHSSLQCCSGSLALNAK